MRMTSAPPRGLLPLTSEWCSLHFTVWTEYLQTVSNKLHLPMHLSSEIFFFFFNS